MAAYAVLDDTDVERHLPMQVCIACMEDALRAHCSVRLAGTEVLLANELLRCARGGEVD